MGIIALSLVKICYVVLGVFFLKSNLAKIKSPFLYYQAIKSYNFTANRKLIELIASILISAESLLALLLLTTTFSKAILLVTILHQLFYLLLVIINLNKEFEGNCGCFPLNAPKNMSSKNFIYNLALILIVFILFSIEQKISL